MDMEEAIIHLVTEQCLLSYWCPLASVLSVLFKLNQKEKKALQEGYWFLILLNRSLKIYKNYQLLSLICTERTSLHENGEEAEYQSKGRSSKILIKLT